MLFASQMKRSSVEMENCADDTSNFICLMMHFKSVLHGATSVMVVSDTVPLEVNTLSHGRVNFAM